MYLRWHIPFKATTAAIDGGKMDGFDLITGCSATQNPPYDCYSQYQPSQIPNLASLARANVISDRTFTDGPVESWGSHIQIATSNLDGFLGDTPQPPRGTPFLSGFGCDSKKDSLWKDPTNPTAHFIKEPGCNPET
jgi:hypothetical protein